MKASSVTYEDGDIADHLTRLTESGIIKSWVMLEESMEWQIELPNADGGVTTVEFNEETMIAFISGAFTVIFWSNKS